MVNLLINVDHVGTLRNAREETFPDPVHAAARCEHAGADGIVFHLREDRRHITERDVRLFRETVQGKLDFELSTDEEIVSILSQTGSEQSIAEQLIAAAQKNGGKDNISAILVGPDPAPSVETIGEDANLQQANSVAIEGRIHGLQFWLWMGLAFLALIIAVVVVYDII